MPLDELLPVHFVRSAADDHLVQTLSDEACFRSIASLKAMGGIFMGWCAALLLMHYPMLLTGMQRMQADLGDSRLNNYFLEHSWRWITLKPGSSVFWNMPFFYPQENTAAYSDLMLSFAPFYWCWRLIGLQPDTAFQCWMLMGTSLNFLVTFAWLRGCCKCGWGSSVIGAVFFAAAGPRATQLGHQQLQWQLFPMLAIISVYQIFGREDVNGSTARWWILLGTYIIGQFWGGFYNGWFLGLGLVIGSMLAILWRDSRKQLAAVVRRDATIITAVGFAVAVLLAPAAIQYLSVMKDVGGHRYEEVQLRLARPEAWILPGPFSIERSWFNIPAQRLEQAIACGVITSVIAIIGIGVGRRKSGVTMIAVIGLVIACLGTVFLGRYSLWWVAYNTVPGAEVIRVPARIGLMLLIPAALGISQFIDHFSKHYRLMVVVVVALCLLEQASFMPSYDKQEARDRISAITSALPRDAKCFFYLGNNPLERDQSQIDAMWASLFTGIPTVNGYSGSIPKGWDMVDDVVSAPNSTVQQRQLHTAATNWAKKWAIDPTEITWLQANGSDHVCLIPSIAATANLDMRPVP